MFQYTGMGRYTSREFFYITSMNASKPNSGTAKLGDFGLATSPRLSGNRTWAQWLGYQISSSAAYADDATGAKVYIGSDIGSLYALDATNGKTLSVFTAGANIPSSPAVWDGKLYAASINGKVYCFDDSPKVDFSVNAASSKGTMMWVSESVTIGGRLVSNPVELVWTDDTFYLPTPSTQHPGLPNANVIVSITKPDGTSINLTDTTDKNGDFSVSYTPTEVGNWGWVAFYEGKSTNGLTYNAAYTEFNTLSVNNPSAGPSAEATATPTQNLGFPVEYAYAIIAVIIIAIIAVAAFLLRKKKPTQ